MSDQQDERRGTANFYGAPADVRERDDDEQSIIDVFEFDDTAQDAWLCSTGTRSRRNSFETKVKDLDAWLHADVLESEVAQTHNGSRRSIDTRTFTRIKRRFNRLSFEAVEASVSPETMPFSLSNVWKNQMIPESSALNTTTTINNNNNDKERNTQRERRDSVPMMLRPKTNQVLAALLSESPSSISSQTSMEAFMNMARSKEGISSLVSDMSDSDVSHYLMNISQPSLLYSSIISDGKGDESIQAAAVVDSFVDSQILTESMMEASMFKEVQDTTMLAEFLKHNDCTVLQDETFCKSFDFDANDKTFVNDQLGDKTYININDNYLKSLEKTFVANEKSKSNDTFISFPSPICKSKLNSTKIMSSQENLLSTCVISNDPSSLNSTKTLSIDQDIPVLFQNKDGLSTTHTVNEDVLSTTHTVKEDVLSTTVTINSENKTDLTFELKSASSSPTGERLDATFQTSNFSAGQIPQLSRSTETDGNSLDATFNAVPTLRAELLQEVQRSSGNKFDATYTSAQLPNIESKLDVTYDRSNTAKPFNDAEVLDATYVQVPSLHRPESQSLKKSLDVTYDSTQVNSKISNTTSTRRISYANKNPVESQRHFSNQNRFNTFRKDSKSGNRLSKAPQAQENYLNKMITAPLQPHEPNTKNNDNLYQQRFNTFSKKMTTIKNTYVENRADQNKADSTFTKQPDKLPRQIQPPRQLSKLPQLFQKSNPNLGSTLKPLGRLTLESDAGFSKGSQPNISRNMYPLGRFKSEQRLLQMKHNAEFASGDGSSRSMESIESTASAHSAPDLDDRFSTCSDSSRTSYTIKPRNLETIKRLASMEEQGGKFGGSTPKIKGRQILENTWVEEKDLPSPIFKNGIGKNYVENGDSMSISPTYTADFNAKTSSPLTISPVNSEQAINIIGNDDGGIEATKENIQVTENVRPKQIKVPSSVSTTTNTSKLKRPTNWTGAPNKVVNGSASGIPRPASRIPAPKFARPNLK